MNEHKGSRVLVTGGAGFIGSHLCRALLEARVEVVAIDNMNSYYDVELKRMRLDGLRKYPNFAFVTCDLADAAGLEAVFDRYNPDAAVNLAAQAGVRYSITHPRAFISSNIIGFFNVLESCRRTLEKGRHPVRHLVYASSSSVYGDNNETPYSVESRTDSPVSLYAATKKSDELMAYAYAKLYKIPATGLRFFTVYGPMGRPDMAYFHFADKMARGEPIQLYNNGDMYRDFTYIDDVVSSLLRIIERPPAEDGAGVPHRVYNIGNSCPVSLTRFVDILEKCLMDEGVISSHAVRELLPMQPGDVYRTCADAEELMRDFGFRPDTPLETGLARFAGWYREYRGLGDKRPGTKGAG